MYVSMVIRPVYKKKEVSSPPNKMKHISPLQKDVFLSLTCRILKKKKKKKNHTISTISPFFLVMIAKGYKKLESCSQEI